MHFTLQRGSAALMMVIMVLLLGTLMLNATRQQLDDAMSLVGDERLYFQQLARAVSALAWGERLRWPAPEKWHCQRQDEHHWRACFQPGHQLLRADSGPGTLTLWRWVKLLNQGAIQTQAHGWLDYCPLKQLAACYVD